MSDYEYDYGDEDYMEEEGDEYQEVNNYLLDVEEHLNKKNYKDAIEILGSILLLNQQQSDKKVKYTFKLIVLQYSFKALTQLINYEQIEKNISELSIYLKPEYCLSKNEATESIVKILTSLLENIEIRCQKGSSNSSILTDNSQILLDIYSYQIQLAIQEDNIIQLKEIIKKSEAINSSIFNSKSYAIIKENSGKLMMLDHQYKQAEENLLEAFRLYQSLTNLIKAKEMLKYVTICSILLHSTINIFHSQEAQQFQTDFEMINLQNLRYFYEHQDLKKFQNLFQQQFAKDKFICKFENELLKLVAMERIEIVIKTYRIIKITYLGEVVGVKQEKIIQYLIELIMDGKINGKIDMVERFFENYALITNEADQKKTMAIQQWVDLINI